MWKNMLAKADAYFKGWRTLFIAAFLGAVDFVCVIQGILDAAGVDLSPLIPSWLMPYWAIVHAILMWYMRTKTTGPVGAKTDPVSGA